MTGKRYDLGYLNQSSSEPRAIHAFTSVWATTAISFPVSYCPFLFHPHVLCGLLASAADFSLVLVEAFEDSTLARLRICTQRGNIALAFIGKVPERHHCSFELVGGIIEGIDTSSGQLILIGIQARQYPSFSGSYGLTIGIELLFASFHSCLYRALLSKRCSYANHHHQSHYNQNHSVPHTILLIDVLTENSILRIVNFDYKTIHVVF